MSIIKGLEQGSQKWLNYRRSKIMATDSSVIIGTNPYQNVLHLWEEKLLIRDPQPVNDAMKRGSLLEEEARALASTVIGIDFEPCVYESDKNPWQAASLDGLSKCGRFVLEIKCPKEKTHLEAIQGSIKDYYITQMQHQSCCVPLCEKIFYFSYRPEYEQNPSKVIEIAPDLEFNETLTEKEHEFYIKLCTLCPPVQVFKPRKN